MARVVTCHQALLCDWQIDCRWVDVEWWCGSWFGVLAVRTRLGELESRMRASNVGGCVIASVLL